MSADRQPITAPDAPAAVGPYSHAVRSDGFLFLSGQTPLDPATGVLVAGDVGEQTRQCLRNLEAVCTAAGASLRNAVRCGIFVTDMGTFGEVNTAYAEFFPDAPPARSTVGVAALPVGAQVEIDAIVALGD
ncbi:Rid family detoxifying hydrolase [Baekduia sp.]|jgi:2-iminobutanoate/2-iminopropanoate deaminase|uniref:RidA family protein n=1 Tax=Baekduia sp. TaxID=2600305 RepID=UPI002DF96FBA|nr:Rid family detoxifying hydrolase [Baekduia sp.]